MCGMHWYREELEKADGDRKKLEDLRTMMGQRYEFLQEEDDNSPGQKEIRRMYQEIDDRIHAL